MIKPDNDRTKGYECCFVQLNCEITLPVVRKENKLQVIDQTQREKSFLCWQTSSAKSSSAFCPCGIGPKTKTRNSRTFFPISKKLAWSRFRPIDECLRCKIDLKEAYKTLMNRFVGKGIKNSLYFIKFKTSSASSAFWFLALYRRDKTRNSISGKKYSASSAGSAGSALWTWPTTS